MRLSDIRDKSVRTTDGKYLGRVHEIHCEDGIVTALMAGPGSFIERLTARNKGERVPWKCVRKIEPKQIIVTRDSPQQTA